MNFNNRKSNSVIFFNCKMLCIILVISLFFSNILFPETQQVAYCETTYYARIKSNDVFLLSSPELSSTTNKMFLLPQSYFVKVLDEESDIFYKVQYVDIVGYLPKESITFVKETPITPFVTASFRVFCPNGLMLRLSPNTAGGNSIVNIPFLSSDIFYYGIVHSEESIVYKGDVWYYCRYSNNEGVFRGYVYSVFCDLLPDTPTNSEILTEIEPPDFTVQTGGNTSGITDEISTLPTATQIGIIVLACLPCLAIVYFLFKPTKIALDKPSATSHSNKPSKKKKVKRLRGSDYYEIFEE